MKKTKITKEFLIQDLLDTEANGFEENVIYPFWLKYSEEIKVLCDSVIVIASKSRNPEIKKEIAVIKELADKLESEK